jgi:hypothetical protein
MAWVAHTFVLPWDVAWYWGCVPLAEKRASSAVSSSLGLLLPGAHADIVDGFFFLDTPIGYEKRLAAWKTNWQIREEELETEDEPIRIYTTDAGWAGDLFSCQLTLGCSLSDSDCAVRPVYSSPGA